MHHWLAHSGACFYKPEAYVAKDKIKKNRICFYIPFSY
ncbi:hypothetical protein PPEP_a3306 [Pseudoalteromonas peptidolytica F12-50-A1]|uniref:Uncharacterized protein n=1 Tax=Pseudoalteromonas peptidolytica F12-50-A1 TaxID=1315280 RepID=A0A8I0T687_9GAMM|nr:hypothetical protein [Pseudoalteromonas peptidolytica F12-50-A1]